MSDHVSDVWCRAGTTVMLLRQTLHYHAPAASTPCYASLLAPFLVWCCGVKLVAAGIASSIPPPDVKIWGQRKEICWSGFVPSWLLVAALPPAILRVRCYLKPV